MIHGNYIVLYAPCLSRLVFVWSLRLGSILFKMNTMGDFMNAAGSPLCCSALLPDGHSVAKICSNFQLPRCPRINRIHDQSFTLQTYMWDRIFPGPPCVHAIYPPQVHNHIIPRRPRTPGSHSSWPHKARRQVRARRPGFMWP